MYEWNPDNCTAELAASLDLRKPSIQAYERLKVAYARSRDNGDRAAGASLPENPAYEYLSLMVPTLAFDNPRVRCATRRPGSQRDVAKAMKFGLDRWVVDVGYRDHTVRMAYDAAFYMGASIVSQQSQPRYGEGKIDPSTPTWPTVDRIPPHRLAIDPLAAHWSEARWMAHATIWDKGSLEAAAKEKGEDWNKEVVAQLTADAGLKGLGRPDDALNRVPRRNEVVLWEFWVPEYSEDGWPGPDEGYHGGILTVVPNQTAGKDGANWVRKPRPYYGPRWGPYTVYGAYMEPDSSTPLAPLMAVSSQIEDLNDHARSIGRSCTTYKRLVLVDSTNPKLVNALKSTPDTYVVPVQGLDANAVIPIEVGGVTDQQLQQYGIVKGRLDRILAMGDPQRGVVKGGSTATENTIADEATGKRLAYLKQQFADAVTHELRTVAWFMYHDDRVVFPLGQEAGIEMGMGENAEPWFHGGDTNRESGATFDDLELEIEPYSMEHTSESVLQTRILQGVQLVTQLAPMVPQMPWVDWKTLLGQVGDALNNPSFGDAIDVDMALKMGQQMMQQGGMGAPGGAKPTDRPMLAKQAGAAGGGVAPMPQLPQNAGNMKQPASRRNNGSSKAAATVAAKGR